MRQSWLNHALRRSGWRPQNQVVGLATLGVALALILGALYLSQLASIAGMGRELEDLIAERDKLELINEQLRAEIANFMSVPRLLFRAQQLDFIAAGPEDVEYLIIDGYNPSRADTVAPLDEPDDQAPVYEETFLGWLQQQWDALRNQFDNFGVREVSP